MPRWYIVQKECDNSSYMRRLNGSQVIDNIHIQVDYSCVGCITSAASYRNTESELYSKLTNFHAAPPDAIETASEVIDRLVFMINHTREISDSIKLVLLSSNDFEYLRVIHKCIDVMIRKYMILESEVALDIPNLAPSQGWQLTFVFHSLITKIIEENLVNELEEKITEDETAIAQEAAVAAGKPFLFTPLDKALEYFEDGECQICSLPYGGLANNHVEKPVKIPCCGNIFGDLCIKKWVFEDAQLSCPKCRVCLGDYKSTHIFPIFSKSEIPTPEWLAMLRGD